LKTLDHSLSEFSHGDTSGGMSEDLSPEASPCASLSGRMIEPDQSSASLRDALSSTTR
jgi:hypothetical protein